MKWNTRQRRRNHAPSSFIYTCRRFGCGLFGRERRARTNPAAAGSESEPAQPAGDGAQTATSGTLTSEDTAFVQKATAAGRMEVEHEKMAASKASNAVQVYTNRLVKVRAVVRRLR